MVIVCVSTASTDINSHEDIIFAVHVGVIKIAIYFADLAHGDYRHVFIVVNAQNRRVRVHVLRVAFLLHSVPRHRAQGQDLDQDERENHQASEHGADSTTAGAIVPFAAI